MKSGQGARSDLWALVVGMLVTAAWHRPLLVSGLDRMPGDRGDARTYVYFVEHWFQVFRGHAEALSPGMFYPVKGTIGYSETMVVHALPYSGLRLAGMDMFSAMAVMLILFSFLNYVSCFFLLRRVLRLDVAASVAGALFFAFNSPRFNQTGHYGFHASFFLPIVIACLVRLVQRRADITQRRAFALLAVAALTLALQFIVSPYQGWLFVFWMCLFLAIVLAIPSTRLVLLETGRGFWRATIGAALVFLIGLCPFLLVYMPVAASVGPRSYSEVLQLTPDVWSLMQMGPRNYIWGGVSRELLQLHPQRSSELYVGIGLVPSLVLLALTLWAIRSLVGEIRRPKSERTASGTQSFVFAAIILATALFYALAMKYGGEMSPWRFVYVFVPGADGLRAIARHVLVLTLPISIAFAIVVQRGLERALQKPTALARQSLTAALLAAVTFGIAEQFGRAPFISGKTELSRLQSLASSLPQNCAVFYAAAAPNRSRTKHEEQIDAMLISVMTHVPTVNGYSGHVPAGWSLREVEAADYEQRVARWIAGHHVSGPVCRLEIDDWTKW